MAVRCCSAQVDPSSGGIQLDLGPELLQEGMRLQLHAFTREAARDEVSGTPPPAPPLLRCKGTAFGCLVARALYPDKNIASTVLSLCGCSRWLYVDWLAGHGAQPTRESSRRCTLQRGSGSRRGRYS